MKWNVDIDKLPKAAQDEVRQILRREFTDYFLTMTKSSTRWPTITPREFADALTDSLVDVAKAHGLASVAYLQTLVYDLQDRINNMK